MFEPTINTLVLGLSVSTLVFLVTSVYWYSRSTKTKNCAGGEGIIAECGDAMDTGSNTLYPQQASEPGFAQTVARQEYEAKYLALFESTGDGILLVCMDSGRILDCNFASVQLFGYPRDELLKLRYQGLQANLHSAAPDRLFDQIMASGHYQDHKMFKTRDATVFTARLSANLIRLGNSIIGQLLISNASIYRTSNTDIDAIAERLRFGRGETFLAEAANYCGQSLNIEFFAIGTQSPQDKLDHTVCLTWYHNGIRQPPRTEKISPSPFETLLGDGIFHCTSGYGNQYPGSTFLSELQLDSFIGSGLFDKNGQILGFICAMSAEPVINPDRALATVRIFSVKIAAELEHLQIEQASRDFRSIADHASDFLAYVDTELKFRVVNEHYCHTFNKSLTEIRGQSPAYLFGENFHEVFLRPALESCLTGKFVRRVHQGLLQGMENGYYEFHFDAVTDKSGDVIGAVISTRDITDLERREQEQELRANLLETLIKNKQLSELLVQIALCVEHHNPECLCSILLLNEDQKTLVSGAAPSLPKFYSEAFNGLKIGNGVGCCGTAAHTGKRVIVEDIHNHPFWANYKPLTDKVKMKSCWSEPILSSDLKVLGTFALYYFDKKIPDPKDIALIENVAAIASIGIQRHHAEARRMDLEKQLRQSQKLEALGQLTGGIAHDFNNILGSIMGFNGLALMLSENEKNYTQSRANLVSYLQEINLASIRAKDLVSKMLAFARTGLNSPNPVDLKSLLDESLQLLRPLMPASIEIVTPDFIPQAVHIVADTTQFEQVIINLCINARDAMDRVGKIGISVETRAETGARCSSCCETFSGNYVEICVSDCGRGMKRQVVDHIFEPFYTTKDVGQGSGMGLPMVHGIVHECGGHITVNTNSGTGTAVTLYYPVLRPTTASIEASGPSIDPNTL